MKIVWLSNLESEDRQLVGNKAATLGILSQSGFPIPDGFCIAGEALQLGEDKWWAQVRRAYRQLAPDQAPVAVRSSAFAEDLPGASFAGQYVSVLNVHGEQELQEAIYRCWQGAHSRRVEAYSCNVPVTAPNHAAQIHFGGAAPDSGVSLPAPFAVIVQRQINATVSGTLFTQDPLSGDRSQMLIEAAPGLGNGLLGGHVSPLQVWIDRQGRVSLNSQPELLTIRQCQALADFGERVEQILGPGQDLEWALSEDKFYLLQARLITGRVPRLPLSQVWTRANVGEVLPNVVTPLTWSAFQVILQSNQYRPETHRESNTENRLHLSALRRRHGRMYIRLDALLDSFSYLPAVTPQVLGQVLGVELPAIAQNYARPAGPIVRLAQAMYWLDAAGICPRLAWLVKLLPPLPAAGPDQVKVLLHWAARCFQLHLKATAYAISAFGILERWLERRMPGEAEAILTAILRGDGNFHSATQGRDLWHLARQVKTYPALSDLLQSGLEWPVFAKAAAGMEGSDQFFGSFHSFLHAYGARAVGEFELAVPRWREDPSFVLAMLGNYLASNFREGQSDGDAIFQQRRAELNRVLSMVSLTEARILNHLVAVFQRYAAQRENLKYRLIEGFACLRESFLEIASQLLERGAIDQESDVFFLHLEEVFALQSGNTVDLLARSLVFERRCQHVIWEAQPVPELVLGNHHLPDTGKGLPGGLVLTGVGSSPGVVEGLARVLSDPAQARDFQPGEILVAPHTDPGWTPLFLICKAVVTEIGGFLSHGATVAREYAIPCVVNVRGVTAQIRTGDRVRVDGTHGRVTRMDNSSDSTGA